MYKLFAILLMVSALECNSTQKKGCWKTITLSGLVDQTEDSFPLVFTLERTECGVMNVVLVKEINPGEEFSEEVTLEIKPGVSYAVVTEAFSEETDWIDRWSKRLCFTDTTTSVRIVGSGYRASLWSVDIAGPNQRMADQLDQVDHAYPVSSGFGPEKYEERSKKQLLERLKVAQTDINQPSALESLLDLGYFVDHKTLQGLYDQLTDQNKESYTGRVMRYWLNPQKELVRGDHYVDFEMTDSSGNVHRLKDYVGKGKFVVLFFWAPQYVDPLMVELLNNPSKEYADQLTVIGVNVSNRPFDEVATYDRQQIVPIKFLNMRTDTGDRLPPFNVYSFGKSFGTVVVIDLKGNIGFKGVEEMLFEISPMFEPTN